jgi:hypothetical protein
MICPDCRGTGLCVACDGRNVDANGDSPCTWCRGSLRCTCREGDR